MSLQPQLIGGESGAPQKPPVHWPGGEKHSLAPRSRRMRIATAMHSHAPQRLEGQVDAPVS